MHLRRRLVLLIANLLNLNPSQTGTWMMCGMESQLTLVTFALFQSNCGIFLVLPVSLSAMQDRVPPILTKHILGKARLLCLCVNPVLCHAVGNRM